ncbi:amino acid/amide ABC transporter substrate-binding protein (HAAT family) [Paraburkholderia unamae]|uniref:ABC transporter substrate-binding protein n=1 Tax=Paraburkholderia unamae TaxID=219649 RepID=UPI000DC335D5|nr:amino acid/amide ABC transporter substrate-binding protein (HAAT family) [Paraburkholderia unamae]
MKSVHALHRGALAGMLAALALFAGTPRAHAEEGVKIGLILDMTGVYSDISGKGSVTAAQLAIDDFGGKALGHNVELVVGNSQGHADTAATTAREWFDVKHVDAIMDVTGSSAALAVLNIARAKGKILFLSGPASDRLTGDLCTPTSVHYAYDSYALANSVARTVANQGGKRWYFITADYAGGHDIVGAARTALGQSGASVLGEVPVPLGAADFSSAVVQAQNSGAGVIGLASFGGDLVNVVKAAREFGVRPGGPQRMASLLMYINDVHAIGLQTAQGMVLSEAFYWDMNPQTRAFSRRYYEKVKAMPNMSQAAVYSSVLHYLKAVQAANSTDATVVMRKMREMPVSDFFATNGRIREDGLMVHDMYLFQVKSPAESKYPWDYYKLLATIPADKAFRSLAQSGCPLVKP